MKVPLFILTYFACRFAFGLSPNIREMISQRDRMNVLRDKAIDKCTETFQIDKRRVIESLSQFDVPDEPMFKCWYNCFMVEMGFKKGRSIDWDMAKNFTKLQLLDEELFEMVEELYDNCKIEVPIHFRDHCILAYEFILCEVRNWSRVGLPLD
ncbi:uncharacterized protein [Halyomorpha halys]|uniref:uncharacterized protein n=1 Tax=Halyomorpha halys TaxID=286706 RepID=UPI0006D50C26|nr:uncharacterized protein LOC106683287 [Halyomorpha halys]